MEQREWLDLLDRLNAGEIPTDQVGSAIVKLGKPYDPKRIAAAKDTVARYLCHEDAWARHEAMWFLTSWARLPEYEPALIHALRNDSHIDNRSYAAVCLARLRQGSMDRAAVNALKDSVEDNKEDELVRKFAYLALMEIVQREHLGFSPHDNELSDIDWEWLRTLQS